MLLLVVLVRRSHKLHELVGPEPLLFDLPLRAGLAADEAAAAAAWHKATPRKTKK